MIEVLIGMLLFAIGILGLVGLQAKAIQSTAEARYRSEASFLANQLLAILWIDRANLSQYAHFPASTNCNPSGVPSVLTSQPTSELAKWFSNLEKSIPGALAGQQQITVHADNSVDITLCWKAPQDSSWRRLDIGAYINSSDI